MTKKSPDEQPKNEIAKKVITAKRRYFVPGHGSVNAESAAKASEIAQRHANVKEIREEGDGNR